MACTRIPIEMWKALIFSSMRAPRLSTHQMRGSAHRRMPTHHLPLQVGGLFVCCEDHRPLPTLDREGPHERSSECVLLNTCGYMGKETAKREQQCDARMWKPCVQDNYMQKKTRLARFLWEQSMCDFRLGRSRNVLSPSHSVALRRCPKR